MTISRGWQRRQSPVFRFTLDSSFPPCHSSNVAKKMDRSKIQPKRSRFRHGMWFVFFLVCAVVFCFPPWIEHSNPAHSPSCKVDWFFSLNFHFWTYQPYGMANVMSNTGCTVVYYEQYKSLNYCIFGIEIAILGILALVLRYIIRQCEMPPKRQ